MLRRLVAAGLCLSVQVGAFHAPLVHAHLDGHHDDHHRPAAVHAHFGGHAHSPAEVERHMGGAAAADHPIVALPDEPEQTTRLQIFVAVAAAAFTTPALPPARFVLAPTPESAMRRQPDVVRSHGPPVPDVAGPRAPPVPSV